MAKTDNVEFGKFRKNIMGTLSFEMKLPSMRKMQDFIVYPVNEKTNYITIQSDTRFGKIEMTTGRGLMSQSHANGAYAVHLHIDKLVKFELTESQLDKLKEELAKTAGRNVGSAGVVSDNQYADKFAAGGKTEQLHNSMIRDKVRSLEDEISTLNLMLNKLESENTEESYKKSQNLREYKAVLQAKKLNLEDSLKEKGGYMAAGGELVDKTIDHSGRYLDIVGNHRMLHIHLNDEGREMVMEERENGRGDEEIMYELFEDVAGNSDLMYHTDLGESGFGMTSSSGVTAGYVYGDDGELEPADDTAVVYVDNDSYRRSPVEEMLHTHLVLKNSDFMAKGGKIRSLKDDFLMPVTKSFEPKEYDKPRGKTIYDVYDYDDNGDVIVQEYENYDEAMSTYAKSKLRNVYSVSWRTNLKTKKAPYVYESGIVLTDGSLAVRSRRGREVNPDGNEVYAKGGMTFGGKMAGAGTFADGGLADDNVMLFDSLKKGDTIKITFKDSISGSDEATLKVKSKTVVNKGKATQSEKINFINTENPHGVGWYAYKRQNGFVGFAWGDMAIWDVRVIEKYAEGGGMDYPKSGTNRFEECLNFLISQKLYPYLFDLNDVTNLYNVTPETAYEIYQRVADKLLPWDLVKKTIHQVAKDDFGLVYEDEMAKDWYAKGGSVNTYLPVGKEVSGREINNFIEYVEKFYGKNGLYAEDLGGGFTKKRIKEAVNKYLADLTKGETWGHGDSLDRERVRQYLQPEYSLLAKGGHMGKKTIEKVTLIFDGKEHKYDMVFIDGEFEEVLLPYSMDTPLFDYLEKEFDDWMDSASRDYHDMYFSDEAIYTRSGAIKGAIEVIDDTISDDRGKKKVYNLDKGEVDTMSAFS